MDFFSLLKILVRRWFVVIPVLALTAFLGLVFIGEPQVLYSSGGSELLVSRPSEEGGVSQQAGSQASVAISSAGGVLSSGLQAQSYRRSLADRGLVDDFVVESDPTLTVLTITLGSTSSANAVATGEAIVTEASGVLAAAIGPVQAGAFRIAAVGSISEADVVLLSGQQTLRFTLVILPAVPNTSAFPPNLTTVRTLLDLSLRPEVRAAVRAVAPTAAYAVTSVARDAAAIVSISVQAEDPGEIEPAYRALVAALNDELASLQETAGGANDADQTVLVTLNPPVNIAQTSSSIVRSAAGFALLGFAVACGLAILVDSLILRRRARPSKPTQDDD